MDDTREAAEGFARQFGALYLRFHRRDAKGAGLTAASRSVLQHLAMTGPLTVGELRHHLDRAQSVVSDIVAQLTAKGLLECHDDAHDRRRRLVWLSPAGFELLERDRDVLSLDLLERALGAMSPDERAALLGGVAALLRADDTVPGPRRTPTHRLPPAARKERNERL